MTGYLIRWVLRHLDAAGQDALASYLAFVREEGDPLNDWLTHLPQAVRGIVYLIGQVIAGGVS